MGLIDRWMKWRFKRNRISYGEYVEYLLKRKAPVPCDRFFIKAEDGSPWNFTSYNWTWGPHAYQKPYDGSMPLGSGGSGGVSPHSPEPKEVR
jgi:hypothetical protein